MCKLCPLVSTRYLQVEGVQSHLLVFINFKVALNPLRIIFLNFAKSGIVSCLSQFDNGNGCHRPRRVFLPGQNVTMLTCYVTLSIYMILLLYHHLLRSDTIHPSNRSR